MKLNHPLINKTIGLLGMGVLNRYMSTLDFKVAYHDRTIDPAFPECRGQKIYVLWHEYIFFPLYLRGHCNLAMLLSQHRDADLLTRAAIHFGLDFVRGSTRRGGVAAIRELLRRSRHMHLAITPDGPRGPRRRLAQGAVYLASKLNLPIVAMGFGYDRPWRFRRAWDNFAVRRPYSRARAVVSPHLWVPPDLDRDGLEGQRQRVEAILNGLTTEAERWAGNGLVKRRQERLGRQPAPLDAWRRAMEHTAVMPCDDVAGLDVETNDTLDFVDPTDGLSRHCA